MNEELPDVVCAIAGNDEDAYLKLMGRKRVFDQVGGVQIGTVQIGAFVALSMGVTDEAWLERVSSSVDHAAVARAAAVKRLKAKEPTKVFKCDAPRSKFRPHMGAKQLAKAARRATKAAKGVTGHNSTQMIVDEFHGLP